MCVIATPIKRAVCGNHRGRRRGLWEKRVESLNKDRQNGNCLQRSDAFVM